MPASYSLDFRKKVMCYVSGGGGCNSASIKFEIAANTVRNWYKRYKLEGNYAAKKVGGRKGSITSQDIVSYVDANPNFTLLEIGDHFKMSSVGAYYWLKKLGYSYKKTFTYVEASAEKCKVYKEEINDMPPQCLLYILMRVELR